MLNLKVKKLKKPILITIGVLASLFLMFFILIRLAFGPLKSSGEIYVNDSFSLDYTVVYTADFAGEFYDVDFKINDSTIGRNTFHNMSWEEDIFVKNHVDETIIIMPDSTMNKDHLIDFYIISFDKNFKIVKDSTLVDIKNINQLLNKPVHKK